MVSDVVDPLNFEKYLTDHSDLISKDAHKDLLAFPPDDIEVCLVGRKIRTGRPILPDYTDLKDQEDLYINECVRTYTSNWVVVSKK